MKYIISLFTCTVFYFASFAQNSSSNEFNKENYLHKSHVQNTIGYYFLGAGVSLIIAGGIIDKVKQPELLAGFGYEVIGFTSTLASFPFFLSAAKNKRKAMQFTISTQNTTVIRQYALSAFIQPATSLKISF